MKKRSLYMTMIPPAIVIIITMLIAYYSLGVIEKNSAKQRAENHINSVIISMQKNDDACDLVYRSFSDDYEARTMTISLILASTPRIVSEEMTAEILLAATGAEELSICDGYGNITFSTSDYGAQNRARKEFSEGLKLKNYRKTITVRSENDFIFETAVSRRDKDGLVITKFRSSVMNSISEISGFPDYYQLRSVYPSAACAVIDSETMTYISHTSGTLNGTACMIPKDEFRQGRKSFSYTDRNNLYIVCFGRCGNRIVADILLKNEIYAERNKLMIWMCVIAAAAFISFALAIRDFSIGPENEKTDDSQ